MASSFIQHDNGKEVLIDFVLFQTRLDLNNFVMFQDPQYFKEPERFMPERWLRDGSAKDIHPYILTPFGHGPRMCAGKV